MQRGFIVLGFHVFPRELYMYLRACGGKLWICLSKRNPEVLIWG